MEDVKGKTGKPIVPRNTLITGEIIDVLQAFLIDEVDVEEVDYNKTTTKMNKDGKHEDTKQVVQPVPSLQKGEFVDHYLQVVDQLKKEFKKWQAGIDVDVLTIRKNIIPLFDHFLKNPYHLLVIHKYGQKQDDFYLHAISTALISGLIAKKLDFPKSDANQVVLAAVLSNCGMAKLDPVLMKKSFYTEIEEKEIRKHPGFSYKMVQDIPSLNQGAKLAILQHEEREDGSGYPFGEKGDRIHPYAKIIACSDEYYKIFRNPKNSRTTTPFQAIEKLESECFGKIAIDVIDALKTSIAQYAVDVNVLLSNHMAGKIVFVDLNSLSQPVVRLEEDGQIISLHEQPQLKIIDVF
mgnify:CR=1 FL=1